jgi:hypothetical protein
VQDADNEEWYIHKEDPNEEEEDEEEEEEEEGEDDEDEDEDGEDENDDEDDEGGEEDEQEEDASSEPPPHGYYTETMEIDRGACEFRRGRGVYVYVGGWMGGAVVCAGQLLGVVVG